MSKKSPSRIKSSINIFQRFVIGGPFSLDATQSTGTATNTGNIQNAVGQCVDDTFVLTSTGRGSPVICGVNTGQHSKFDLFQEFFWSVL